MERIKHEDEEFFVVVKGENNVIVGEEIRSMSHY
jgi:mannose-6-phosphate isomerase-like protein (cupin superfamily)